MPSKREMHRQALRPLLWAALASPGLLSPSDFNMARYSPASSLRANLLDPDITALEDYLLDHSELPGQRANLELVGAFADEVGALCQAPDVSMSRSYVGQEWLLWHLLHRYPPAVFGSDADSPLQMPQICGAVALGEWSAAFAHTETGVTTLLELANSPLWRVREAVAMGLQRLLDHAWSGTIRRLRRQALEAGPYQWRAMIAGIAEPALLKDAAHAQEALDLHYAALAFLRGLPPESRTSAPTRTLRQALGYSISVVVAATPDSGFPQMKAWAAWDDPDIRWALRENLKKKRLAKWPEQTAAILVLLSER